MIKKFRYDCIGCGPIEHPTVIMGRLEKSEGFKILSSSAHPVADCWIFEVETDKEIFMPCYVKEVK